MTHTTSTPFFALSGQLVTRAWRVFKNRRQFAELRDWSDEQLKDIGLTRTEVYRALSLPFFTDPTSCMNTSPALRQTLAFSSVSPAANAPQKAPCLKALEPDTDNSGPLAA